MSCRRKPKLTLDLFVLNAINNRRSIQSARLLRAIVHTCMGRTASSKAGSPTRPYTAPATAQPSTQSALCFGQSAFWHFRPQYFLPLHLAHCRNAPPSSPSSAPQPAQAPSGYLLLGSLVAGAGVSLCTGSGSEGPVFSICARTWSRSSLVVGLVCDGRNVSRCCGVEGGRMGLEGRMSLAIVC